MFRTVKDYQMPAPSPDSVAGSEGPRLISRRSINDRFRRMADARRQAETLLERPVFGIERPLSNAWGRPHVTMLRDRRFH